jgi:hypothetical protein
MASGQTLVTFHPRANERTAANTATPDRRNGHPVLNFDAATDETAYWTAVMPSNYSGGGITASIWWTDANDTNAAHACYWEACFERMTGQDLDADSFAATQTGHGSPNGTSGIPVVTTIAFTNGAQMDSVVAGDVFRFQLNRDANNGSDDMANDGQLLAVVLAET